MRQISLTLIIILFSHQLAWSLETAKTLLDSTMAKSTGDLSAMRKRGALRVLIPISRGNYFIDDGVEKGLAVELLREFEEQLNQDVKKEIDRLRIILIPTIRDDLIPDLIEGRGDIAIANLTITPDRLAKVDFSEPFASDVKEIIVSSNEIGSISSIDDLAGKAVHVRKTSSYFESLTKANKELEAKGLDIINIVIVEEWLEDEDLLEMVEAGVFEMIVMDDHKANNWHSVFDGLMVHDEFALREGADIGWAFRKNSPELATEVNAFANISRRGTLLGNILIKRYYEKADWLKNPRHKIYQEKLQSLFVLFKKYGVKYNIDPLLLAALAFQESKFDQNAKSGTGAIGIMQILPSTAKDPNVAIPDIRQKEQNIEAGSKYLRFIIDSYFPDTTIADDQKILMALASYNAGPNAIARLRKKASDPNVWFRKVEWEVARSVGSEPIRYVKNIYIYYTLFKTISEIRKNEFLKKL